MLRTDDQGSILIRGGRVVDPSCGRDEVADLAIVDGVVAGVAPRDAKVIDAAGWIVCPGLTDMHVHLREPGQTHKESIESGTASAAAGGFTHVVCMPNTSPPLDAPEHVRWVLERAESVGHCTVSPVACITRDRKGRQLADFAALRDAGAVAFSDDGSGVDDDEVMRAAFERAAQLNALIIQHCEFRSISAGGVMHVGDVSRRLEFPGLDPRSEEAMIERDIDLCAQTGARNHFAHISTAKAVEMVRRAKAGGLPVSAEACTHHLILTDEACALADPNTKMHPPLRPQEDVDACRRGLVDGTIDCIVTDHAPHTRDEKSVGFLKAPAGIVGLETAVGVAAKAMIETGLADWPRLIGWFTIGPANVLRSKMPSIGTGQPADLTLIDPEGRWTVDPERFLSKGRNSPFGGWALKGRPRGTIRGRHAALVTAE